MGIIQIEARKGRIRALTLKINRHGNHDGESYRLRPISCYITSFLSNRHGNHADWGP